MTTISVRINGEHRALPMDATVQWLVADLGLTGKRIAVERNGDIVPKSRHAHTLLSDGDTVEIVGAVGGG